MTLISQSRALYNKLRNDAKVAKEEEDKRKGDAFAGTLGKVGALAAFVASGGTAAPLSLSMVANAAGTAAAGENAGRAISSGDFGTAAQNLSAIDSTIKDLNRQKSSMAVQDNLKSYQITKDLIQRYGGEDKIPKTVKYTPLADIEKSLWKEEAFRETAKNLLIGKIIGDIAKTPEEKSYEELKRRNMVADTASKEASLATATPPTGPVGTPDKSGSYKIGINAQGLKIWTPIPESEKNPKDTMTTLNIPLKAVEGGWFKPAIDSETIQVLLSPTEKTLAQKILAGINDEGAKGTDKQTMLDKLEGSAAFDSLSSEAAKSALRKYVERSFNN